jgi:uncharacterized protein
MLPETPATLIRTPPLLGLILGRSLRLRKKLNMNESWFRITPSHDALTITVHAQPGAKRSEIVGLHGDSLKIRIAAPPVEGKANAALLTFIAEVFAVPTKQVRLLRGESARHKVIEIIGSKVHPATLITSSED